MHLRRALLLFALVLGLTALATAIAPTQRSNRPAGVSAAPAPAPPTGSEPAQHVAFGPVGRAAPATRRAAAGSHVVVTVTSLFPGQATMPALGQIGAVTPATAADFDLVAPAPGSYEVTFEPASGGRAVRAGTLVTTR